MGSASCDTRRSAGMAVGPAVGAPSRQVAMKPAKDSSSWRCLSAWFAFGGAALKMDARMCSVSGARDGGLSCVPAREGGTRAPGGGVFCPGVGRPGMGALPRRTTRPWGVRPGPVTHWLWVGGVWAWGPATYTTARAGCARCGGGTRAPGGGGGVSCLGVGRPGFGTLPRPTTRPWGVRPGPFTHWLWVRGLWAWGSATYPWARAGCAC